jgi:site-specific DNA-methyltransferase (cytosine-N4-specific)
MTNKKECNQMQFAYILQLPNYFIQPFERELAKLQLSSFADSEIIEYDGRFEVTHLRLGENHLRKLAFFKQVAVEGDNNKSTLIPDQQLLEKLATLVRRSKNEHDINRFINSLNFMQIRRKESQYLTHNLHPYKGRFYPQMIRALINFTGVKNGDRILDPFCGCGTTLLECFLTDINSVGVDLHPLACFIARVKIESLSIKHVELRREIKKLLGKIRADGAQLRDVKNLNLFFSSPQKVSDLPPLPDMPNIHKWFSPDVLTKIQVIMKNIDKVENENIRNLFKVVFSSILRPISNWDARQVRVRLLKSPKKNVPVFDIFENKLWKSYLTILSYQKIKPKLSIEGNAEARIINGDARKMEFIDSESIDAIITSPPYAMALPYVDTDRLSLFMLGYVTRHTINDLIFQMIGNREISGKIREMLESEFLSKHEELPFPDYFKKTLHTLIQENTKLTEKAFRRKNMPALLYKYFSDMDLCLDEMDRVLKPDKYCIIIVGNNYTTTGQGRVVNIETDRILIDMAIQKGWDFIKKIKKELIPTSPPPLSKIRYESVLIFRKSG